MEEILLVDHVPPGQHECGVVTLHNGVVSYPDTIENIEQCAVGCCDKYRCKVCERTFWIEWPD